LNRRIDLPRVKPFPGVHDPSRFSPTPSRRAPFLIATVLLLFFMIMPAVRRKRAEALSEEEDR
jgi:hypothetical protein